MLAALGELALARGKARVDVPFVASARNRPALLFLESTGLEFRADAGGGLQFRFPARHAAAVVYEPCGAPPRPRGSTSAAPRADGRKAIDYTRIAAGLREPRSVLALMRERARAEAARFEHSAAPRTELEARLAAIWKELLNLRNIGVHDNFFDLGGHSLLAVQLLSRVRQTFGVDLSLEVVYSGEFTIAELAKAMDLKAIEQAGGAEYQALVAELENLSDEEVRALLAEEEARGGAAD
jgi:acyl carrier protein